MAERCERRDRRAAGHAGGRRRRGEPDYIRPIVLFQAQPRNQEVTVEALKKHLIEVEQIPEEQIAVATGDQRELDGIDLFDPKCPIELRDHRRSPQRRLGLLFCLCFLLRLADPERHRCRAAATARVLRMPYAKKREIPELNKAYSFVSEPSFGEAARALADKLVAMGFEEEEVDDHIEHVQMRLDGDGSLFDFEAGKPLIFTHTLTATPEVIEILNESASDRLTVREVEKGKIEISIVGNIDDQLERAIVEAIDVAETRGVHPGSLAIS